MKKILLGLGVLALIAGGVWLFLRSPESDEQTPFRDSLFSNDNPGDTPSQPQVNTVALEASEGSRITVKNFKSDSHTVADEVNTGYYYLGYHTPASKADNTAVEDPPYVIQYIDATQYFAIGLFAEPIAETRAQAERYLMQQLGVGETEMCRLKYMVSVPYSVNKYYAGMDLRFSFCEDAVPLPE